jgi:hypothetical protein
VFNSSDGTSSLVQNLEYEMNNGQSVVLTFSEPCPTTRRLAQYAGARTANNDGLCVREDSGNAEAAYGYSTKYQHPRQVDINLHVPGHLTSMK